MVLLQQNPADADLQRDMPVAQVIGLRASDRAHPSPSQGSPVPSPLPPARYGPSPARKPVAATQDRAAFHIHRSLITGFERYPHPAFLALIERQHQPVVGRPSPGTRSVMSASDKK